jgi:2-polyprenyl-3-methyl-5-hydroxy-6-metoxy-1,4-benzoquinol methylase
MTIDKFSSTLSSYNQYAPQFVQHFEQKLDTTELDKFLEMIPRGGSVLDAGCGSARDTAYMIKQGYNAQGIDLSEGLLAEAKKLHPEVPTQLMSLTDMKFSQDSFDGIWTNATLLHIERKDVPQILKNFYTFLKPNGVLFVRTKEGEGEGPQPVPFDPTLTRWFTFFTDRELTKMIEDAGFDVLNSYTFNSKQRFTNSRDQEWVVIFAKKA